LDAAWATGIVVGAGDALRCDAGLPQPFPEVMMSDPKLTSAGMYDYALGGTANTSAERRAVEAAKRILPELSDGIWANRGFVQRAVSRMASEWGVRQFIDLGAGLPTQRSIHEVVADVVPDGRGRVVYVDSDPTVVRRGQVIIEGCRDAAVIEADICDQVRSGPPGDARLIDFTEPVGLVAAACCTSFP
jgi:hypothetical protein